MTETEYNLPVTKRELEMLRAFNTKATVEARLHLQNIQLIYQDMMRNETVKSYLSYIEEMQNLENKMLVLTKKINGME